MKKSTILRPVSAKAYAGFVERINLVFADSDRRASMLLALGKYLDGDRNNYAAGLTIECRVAFEMLRFDIDLAIARSAKARMRRSRRAEAKLEDHRAEPMAARISRKTVEADETSPAMSDRACGEDCANKDGENADEKSAPVIPRRVRRLAKRATRPKMRWRKL